MKFKTDSIATLSLCPEILLLKIQAEFWEASLSASLNLSINYSSVCADTIDFGVGLFQSWVVFTSVLAYLRSNLNVIYCLYFWTQVILKLKR